MENIRDGNVSVYNFKREIIRKRNALVSTGCNRRIYGSDDYSSRVDRQIKDANQFLAMIDHVPYINCKTVDELKQKISRKRNLLKKELVKLDTETEGHQITISEVMEPKTPEERVTCGRRIAELKEEIHWLHKCLGICKNMDYFN